MIRLSLGKQIGLISGTSFLVAMICVLVFVSYSTRQDTFASAEDNLQRAASTMAAVFKAELDERLTLMRLSTQEAVAEGDSQAGYRQALSRIVESDAAVRGAVLFDRHSRLLQETGLEVSWKDILPKGSMEDMFVGEGNAYLSDVLTLQGQEGRYVVTATKLTERQRTAGYVAAVVDVQEMLSKAKSLTTYGAGGFTVMMDGRGNVPVLPGHITGFSNVFTAAGVAPGSLMEEASGDSLKVLDVNEQEMYCMIARPAGVAWTALAAVSAMEMTEPILKLQQGLLLIGGIGIFLSLALLTVTLRNRLGNPLRRLERFAACIAEDRPGCDEELEGDYHGELATLKTSMEHMVAALRNSAREAQQSKLEAEYEAGRVKKAGEKVEEALRAADFARSEGMVHAAESLEEVVKKLKTANDGLEEETGRARGLAELQNERAAETSTAMEQMDVSIREVARNASDAAAEADETREKADTGARVVKQAVGAVENVLAISEELKTGVSELSTRAQDIGRIMNMINDIADQTNLLALNAAIEAARAGEAGRGFAVVADEVRKLAEKTTEATAEVGRSVVSIQEGTTDYISGIDRAVTAVREAVDLSGESGKALDAIVRLAESASDKIRSIAAATEEQSAAGEQVFKTVDEMRKVSETTAEGMKKCHDSVDLSSSQVQQLFNLIYVFRLIARGEFQGLVEQMSISSEILSLERTQMENFMRAFLDKHECFELFYITDDNGKQITANISRGDFVASYGGSGRGRDWAEKSWFRGAMRNRGTYVSKVYISDASQAFCVTVSTPIMNDKGDIIGVIGADINCTNMSELGAEGYIEEEYQPVTVSIDSDPPLRRRQ